MSTTEIDKKFKEAIGTFVVTTDLPEPRKERFNLDRLIKRATNAAKVFEKEDDYPDNRELPLWHPEKAHSS